MASSRMLKDPNEARLIPITWRGSLPKGDAIVTSVWEVAPTGTMTLGSNVMGQLSTATVASAGTDGIEYDVTNRVTSQMGLILEKTIHVRVQNRVG